MPLHDHFAPPMSLSVPWEGVHSFWASAIAQHLNDTLLPPDYSAFPQVSHGTAVEIDVATYQGMQPVGTVLPTSARWTPDAPAWSAPVQWDQRDLFEVRVIRHAGGPRLLVVR